MCVFWLLSPSKLLGLFALILLCVLSAYCCVTKAGLILFGAVFFLIQTLALY